MVITVSSTTLVYQQRYSLVVQVCRVSVVMTARCCALRVEAVPLQRLRELRRRSTTRCLSWFGAHVPHDVHLVMCLLIPIRQAGWTVCAACASG